MLLQLSVQDIGQLTDFEPSGRGRGGTTMTVDCVMIYTVDDLGRITSLRGHWEPGRAMATLTGP
jgi:hypothetical protein